MNSFHQKNYARDVCNTRFCSRFFCCIAKAHVDLLSRDTTIRVEYQNFWNNSVYIPLRTRESKRLINRSCKCMCECRGAQASVYVRMSSGVRFLARAFVLKSATLTLVPTVRHHRCCWKAYEFRWRLRTHWVRLTTTTTCARLRCKKRNQLHSTRARSPTKIRHPEKDAHTSRSSSIVVVQKSLSAFVSALNACAVTDENHTPRKRSAHVALVVYRCCTKVFECVCVWFFFSFVMQMESTMLRKLYERHWFAAMPSPARVYVCVFVCL